VAPTPDQAAELNLANDNAPHQAVPSLAATPTAVARQEQPPAQQLNLADEPTAAGVVNATHRIERQRLTLMMKVMNIVQFGSTYSEEGSRTSWLGPLLGVLTPALGAAFLGGKVLLTPDASNALRIQTAAAFGGAILVLGIAFLIFRSRSKP
jgi:hypothetical protein